MHHVTPNIWLAQLSADQQKAFWRIEGNNFRITQEAAFGGTFRFRGQGTVDGVEIIRGRFYLASPP